MMQIYHHPSEFRKKKFCVVTSGTFDGVHYGHQKILKRLKEIASTHNGETVVLTFWPHPRMILKPNDNSLKLLSTLEEKAQLLEQAGIEHLVIVPFTQEFSQQSSDEFIRTVLQQQIQTDKLVIGYDHRFGKNREGSFKYLQQNAHLYGFEVEEIPKQDVDAIAVSSTKIRQALQQSDVTLARKLLGRPYSLSGEVVNGNQLGRKMGFPTANIQLKENYKLIPADGVYAVTITLEQKQLQGMMNIGNKPTVSGLKHTLEVHIFDFDRNIYAKNMTIHFIAPIRKEQKFENIEALIAQLQLDEKAAKQTLKVFETSKGL